MPDRLDEGTTRRIAHLARVRLTDTEVSELTTQLEGILGWVDILRNVDIEGVPPTSDALTGAAPLREDVPTPPLGATAAHGASPEATEGGFTVPRIVG